MNTRVWHRFSHAWAGKGLARGMGSLLLCLPVVFFWLSGCAALNASDPRSEEQALRERVHARWEAILAMDFDRVYQFATPAYRQAHNLTHFKNQYAAQVHRKGIEIRDVRFDEADPSVAKVGVLLTFESSGALPGPIFEGTSRVEETWVKQEGQWWYVEPR